MQYNDALVYLQHHAMLKARVNFDNNNYPGVTASAVIAVIVVASVLTSAPAELEELVSSSVAAATVVITTPPSPVESVVVVEAWSLPPSIAPLPPLVIAAYADVVLVS